MAWSAADIPDQSGRVAVVTGVNGGLGLEVSRELARKGAFVVMALRDLGKAEEARGSILGEVPGSSLALQPLDLASLAAVREAAERILRTHHDIDMLVNNAGVMAIPERRTEDGFEMQLAVNHLGHFALTARAHACLAPKPRRPRRLGHQHRSSQRSRDRPGEPTPRRPLRPLARVRPVQACERALRTGARSALPSRRRGGEEHRRPPGVHEHRSAGPKRAGDQRRPEPAVLPGGRCPVRHDAGPGRTQPAPSGDGSERRRWRPVRATVGELGCASPSPAIRPLSHTGMR